jgi:hypothetical protein
MLPSWGWSGWAEEQVPSWARDAFDAWRAEDGPAEPRQEGDPSEEVPWATRQHLEDELDLAALDENVAQRAGYGVFLCSMYGAAAADAPAVPSKAGAPAADDPAAGELDEFMHAPCPCHYKAGMEAGTCEQCRPELDPRRAQVLAGAPAADDPAAGAPAADDPAAGALQASPDCQFLARWVARHVLFKAIAESALKADPVQRRIRQQLRRVIDAGSCMEDVVHLELQQVDRINDLHEEVLDLLDEMLPEECVRLAPRTVIRVYCTHGKHRSVPALGLATREG